MVEVIVERLFHNSYPQRTDGYVMDVLNATNWMGWNTVNQDWRTQNIKRQAVHVRILQITFAILKYEF
jgi:hypothetical protein